jgi:hypothetical protein
MGSANRLVAKAVCMKFQTKRSLASRILRRCLLTAVGAVFAILTWYVWPQELIRPRFTISKETTYFTGPIDADGYVDYLAALNEHMQKGVTKENNGMVLLMQAFGPMLEGGRIPPEFYQCLGIPEANEKGAYLIFLKQFADRNEWPEKDNTELLVQWTGQVTTRPWKANEFARMSEWIKANEKPMQLVEQASKRTRFFAPTVYFANPELYQRCLMAARISCIRPIEWTVDLFVARALLRTTEKQYELAWQALLTTIKFGRLLSQGPTIIEFLAGTKIENRAHETMFSLLNDPGLKLDFLRKCQQDLSQLSPMPDMIQSVDVGDRCMWLDSFLMQNRYGPNALDGLGGNKFEPSRNSVINTYRKLDWDSELKKMNAWYDRLTAVLKEKDRSKKQKDLQEIDATIALMRSKIDEARSSTWSIFDSAQTRLSRTADAFIAVSTPAIRKVLLTQEMTIQRERLVRVGLALAIYRKEKGTYPATLADLTPKYLGTIPDDLFRGKPIIYRKTEDGYLLYSVGPNGLDEEGRDEKSEPPGDDIVLRIPLPVPKKEE